MKYMGSKRLLFKDFKHLLDMPRTAYVEPFVGGCNSLVQMTGPRLAADSNYFLIEMWKALQNGWEPPDIVSEEMYQDVKKSYYNTLLLDKAEDKYPPELVAYVAFSLSFGGKWFGGYRRDRKGTKDDPDLKVENELTQSRRAKKTIMKMVPLIKDVEFVWTDFSNLIIDDSSVVYCDPPYQGTTKYKDSFNHDVFWDWVRYQSKRNKVFVSEFNAPDDFTCIWEQSRTNNLDNKKVTEKLFIYEI